jgi:hypothetical protein
MVGAITGRKVHVLVSGWFVSVILSSSQDISLAVTLHQVFTFAARPCEARHSQQKPHEVLNRLTCACGIRAVTLRNQ